MASGIGMAQWHDPFALANVLLAMAVSRDVDGIEVVTEGAHCFIAVLRDGYVEPVGVVPRDVGEITIVRLGLLAGATAQSGADFLGRVETRMGVEAGEVLVAVSTSPDGPLLELRRIAGGTSPWLPRSQTPAPPSRLGPYLLLEELGRGGAGIVHRAFHESLRREAAVKILYEHAMGRAESRARFLREARAASRVDHPGVVRVLDFGTSEDGRPYLVMERIEGPTLRTVLNDEGPFLPQRIQHIGAGIAAALQVAHRAGVTHCDIKPENIFLLPGDRTKVVDFGAAQLSGSEHRGMRIVGTPAYMAPELFWAEPASPASDLYALGCVLYQLATGRVPYDRVSFLDVAEAHRSAPLPPLDAEVPEALADVIGQCLAKRPEDRPASARAVRAALRGISR